MPESPETGRPLFSLLPVWRRRLGILGLSLASLLTVYALAGFFLAPYLITRYAPQYAAEQLHLQLHLGKVRINPLLFTCEAKELSLQFEKEAPILSVQRLFLDFELTTLFRRAWTFGNLLIESPALYLVIDTDGRLNLNQLLERLPQSEAPPTAGKKVLPRLLLQHLALSGGTVRIVDLSKTQPTETTITPIALEFNDISTIPERHGTYAVSATLPEGGTLGWQGEMSLQPLSATGTIEIKGFSSATAWNFFQDRLNLEKPTGTAQLTASYNFSSKDGSAALRLNPISLTLQDISLREKGAPQPLLQLKNLSASEGEIDFVTHKILFPSIILSGGQLSAQINKAGIGSWQRLAKTAPTPPPTKAIPAKEQTVPWRIDINSFTATDLGLRYSEANRPAPISLEADLAISVTGGSLDLGRQEASIKRLALAGGGVTYIRNPGGRSTSAEQKARPEGGAKQTPPDASSGKKSPWKLALNQLDVSGFHLGYADQKNKPPLAYDLTDLKAQVKDFGSPTDKPVTFEAQAGIRQGGSARLSGTISQAGGQLGQLEGQIGITEMNLKPLASLVTEHAALALVSGNLSLNTHLLYGLAETDPSLTLAGEATIGKLLLNEELTTARFLAWKELAADGIDFGLNPDRLTIKEIRIEKPEAKITIFQDKSVNLAKVRKQTSEPDPEETGKSPFPVAVERIRLKNGVIDFADLSLVLPFATRIEQFKGAATDLSTKPGSSASLKFAGRVGEFGQAKAKGSLVPSNPKQLTDITVTFRNVAMSPLSPYSVTFAGRTIASGKLNLDLGYKIKESELLGENSVVLEDFTLGDRVESPSAMDLPLDLAIALLTDSEGKIDVAVPIRGNIDHPEFSYGQVIRQALFNLLSKVVTSPFRALGSLFGSKSENMDAILFEPGRAELAPPEQEKLKDVAEALGKRDQLQLIVHGGFDPLLDGKALKSSHLRRTLVQKLGVNRGALAYDNAKTQRALEKLAGHELAVFQSKYEERSGQKVKRVNPALALFGKGSGDCPFYRDLFDYLVETAPLPQPELQNLAEQRGLAIIQDLKARSGENSDRITAGPSVQSEALDGAVPAKLELSLR
jgi:uncharacterized protein involved in outer membrane biogenesis